MSRIEDIEVYEYVVFDHCLSKPDKSYWIQMGWVSPMGIRRLLRMNIIKNLYGI